MIFKEFYSVPDVFPGKGKNFPFTEKQGEIASQCGNVET